jgi:tRNA 2-thiouridine synthesizing protein A
MEFDANNPQHIDLQGLQCPLPFLKAKKRMAATPAGTVLTFFVTDPAAVPTINEYCRQHNIDVVHAQFTGDRRYITVRIS